MIDAPGLRRFKRVSGVDALYWVAAAVSRHAEGYPIKTRRLHGDEQSISSQCRILTAELHQWLQKGLMPGDTRLPVFDGTIARLIEIYKRDEYSPYQSVKATTRESYDYNLRILTKTVGARVCARLMRMDFATWFREFSAPVEKGGALRIRRAHGLMTMLRILFGYGKSMRFAGCRDAMEVIEEMTFPMPKRREEAMTYEQADAIVTAALAKPDMRSIALAQAIQFELALRQIDVIGQWIPMPNAESGIVRNETMWTGGVTWSDLTAAKLAKRTSKTGQEGQWDPTEYPLLVKAMAAFSDEERIGPAIINEQTGQPYIKRRYVERWRACADAGGVPRSIWNMDSRAGALTEAGESGAQPDDVRNFATHASFSTTMRYMRRPLAATNRVAKLRVQHRGQKKDDE